MSLFKKFLVALCASLALVILMLFVRPETAWAKHVCGNWGINNGDPSYPGGLIVRTEDINHGDIDGITFRLSATHSSLVNVESSGKLLSNTSTGVFRTGDTIFCGPDGSGRQENHAGWAVFGFGSSGIGGAGNHWVLACKQVTSIGTFIINDNGITETFTISELSAPFGRTGSWVQNSVSFIVINGGTITITFTWRDAPQTGTIQGFKVLMPGNQNAEPAASQTVFLDPPVGPQTSTNPYFLLNVIAGNHTVSVSVPANYAVGYTLCTGPPETWASCHSQNPIINNSLIIFVPAGGTVDLWWHYIPKAHLLGRVWTDTNGNNTFDGAGELISDPRAACQRITLDNVFVKFEGPEIGSRQVGIDILGRELCNPDPYYSTGLITPEEYSVFVVPPPGWLAVTPGQRLNLAPASETHQWFRIRKEPTGTIRATPNPCEIFPANLTCSTDIIWTSLNALTPTVCVKPGAADEIVFATGAAGTKTAPWIQLGFTYTFTLYDEGCGSRVLASVDVTAVEASIKTPPSPQPSPPAPPPEVIGLKPSPCELENAVETTKLTDNYVTDSGGEPPTPAIELSATGTLGQVVTLSIDESFDVDFSQLQSLFGFNNSDYLEGRFQDDRQHATNLLEFPSSMITKFFGPAQKTSPRVVLDQLKVRYVDYVLKKPQLVEASSKYADIEGTNPRTVFEMATDPAFRYPPVPPSLGGDLTEWNETWGRYWTKVPSAYSELYKGKLDFKVTAGEESFQQLKEGKACAPFSARVVEFVMPDFGRTTLVSDLLNQMIVPYQAQSFRDHRIPEQGVGQLNAAKTDGNVLSDVVDFCKKLIISYPQQFLKNLRKVVETSFDYVNPIKSAFAQTEEPKPSCFKITLPGKEGTAPYCALSTSQLQPGDSCADKVSENKLNKNNPNVACTFKVRWSIQRAIDPNDKFWDSCSANADGTYTCTTKVRVFPDFRIPWLAEIWNNTLYSDAKEALQLPNEQVQGAKSQDDESVLGEQTVLGVGSPQVTGRPGIYSFFLPKVLYNQVFPPKVNPADLTQEVIDDCTVNKNAEACSRFLAAIITCLNQKDIDLFTFLLNKDQILSQYGEDIFRCTLTQLAKGLAGQAATEPGGTSVKERFIGATDCGKHFARDLALKPESLQQHLGVTQSCEVVAAAITEKTIHPVGDCTPASDGDDSNGIETSPEELECYIAQIAAGKTEPLSGDNLATVMIRMMNIESGGNQCAAGADAEIGVFQYIASTWKSATVIDARDSGSGTRQQYLAGRRVCLGLPGQDPIYAPNPNDPLRSWPRNFGGTNDGGAWFPTDQIEAAMKKLLDSGACIWSSWRELYPKVASKVC